MKPTGNFVHLEKKDQLDSLNIFEVIDSEKCAYWMPKSSCLRTPFGSQCAHWSQTLLKSARQDFYPNFPLIWDKLSWKTCLWIRSKILGLFVNKLRASHMYSCHSWEKFPQWVQTELCQKPKIHSQIFIAFLKSTGNFTHLEKKDQLDSLNLFKVIDSEKCAYLNAKKLLFQNKLWESTCSLIPDIAEICMAALLSWASISPRYIELENMSLNQIQNPRTIC